MPFSPSILYPFTSFLLVIALIPLLRRLALRSGFVDTPGGRKQHDTPVPPVGGLAIFPVFTALMLIHGVRLEELWFLAALMLLVAAGALDDRLGLPPTTKFAAQWIAALIMVMPGEAHLHALGNLLGFGDLTLGSAGGIMFPAIATVLLVNAINLMDGLDGLAGGLGFAALFWLALGSLLGGDGAAILPSLILMAALAGFLAYNLRHPLRARASVFMGDAGSLALGLALAWFAIRLAQQKNNIAHPVAIAWILALPVFDICAQFARRVSLGRHPFDADQQHFHHHFLNIGLSPRRAAVTIVGLSFLLGAIGLGGTWLGAPDQVMGWLWVALLLIHMFLSLRPRRYRLLLMALRGGGKGSDAS